MENQKIERGLQRVASKPTDEEPRLASCFWCGTAHAAAHPLSVCPACAEIYREGCIGLDDTARPGSAP